MADIPQVVSTEPAEKVPGLSDMAAAAMKGYQESQAQLPTTEERLKAQTDTQVALENFRKTQADYKGVLDTMQKDYTISAQKYAEDAKKNLPQQQAIQPQPSRGLRPYLSPTSDESAETTIGKFLQTMSLFATMAGGGKTGARASLSAFTGMLEGWREGNRDKADRQYQSWKDSTKAMFEQFDNEMRAYNSLMIAERVPLDQKYAAIQLKANEFRNALLANEIEIGNAERNNAALQKRYDAREKAMENFTKIAAMKEYHDQRIADERARLMQLTALKEQEIATRQREIDSRIARRNELSDVMLGQAAQGGRQFWVPSEGQMRPISKEEEMRDLMGARAGRPLQNRPLQPQQVQLLDRLAIGLPILDRLDVLIDRVNAERPGENITTGILNKAALKAGINPSIQEYASLRIDGVLEETAALSGGTPRISILQMIRGEASPSMGMTQEAAHRQVATIRSTLKGRAALITHDPNSLEKMAGIVEPFGPKETKKNDGGESVSRSNPSYQRARQSGMSDADIEAKYKVKITD